jgi:hypothetical protein
MTTRKLGALHLAIVAALAGCSAIGELAYDDVAARERAACDRLIAMSDRQACMQRVNTANKQADAARKKP